MRSNGKLGGWVLALGVTLSCGDDGAQETLGTTDPTVPMTTTVTTSGAPTTSGVPTTGSGPTSDATVDATGDASSDATSTTSGSTGTSTTATTGTAPVCGDGVIEGAEGCDDGPNNGDMAACKADCTPNVCGDGKVGPGESCDEDSPMCVDCALVSCGDGKVDNGEACDDGNADDQDDCTNACTAAACGDGIVNLKGATPEACDDGAMNGDTAACLSTCEVASCGDGLVQAGVEGCDEGDKNADTAACLSTCKPASCGDGFVQAGVEQCDGGAPANGMCQACKLTCNQDFQDCNMSAGDGCEVALCGGTCQNPGMPKGMKAFNYTGQIENFVVPACVKAVTIEGWGAQGGDNPPLAGAGGKGARIKGTFVVAGGDTLKIVVGQMGAKPANSNVANGGAGGGGGSFVWRGNNELLLVAGGGGGSCLQNNGLPHYLGKDGVVAQDGTGSRSHDVNNNAPGGTAGGDGKSVTPSGGKGWNSVLVNPAGGSVCQQYGGAGGYGGGGAGGCPPNICNDLHTGGGGGGYSGGGAGGTCYYYGGGGGGSYNMGANPDNAPGVKTGDGQVMITW